MEERRVAEVIETTEWMQLVAELRRREDELYAELEAARAEIAVLRGDAAAAHPA